MNINRAAKIVGAYRYAFGSAEGEVALKDMAVYCGIAPDPDGDKQNASSFYHAGDLLTERERAYRDGMQDFYKYILTLASAE